MRHKKTFQQATSCMACLRDCRELISKKLSPIKSRVKNIKAAIVSKLSIPIQLIKIIFRIIVWILSSTLKAIPTAIFVAAIIYFEPLIVNSLIVNLLIPAIHTIEPSPVYPKNSVGISPSQNIFSVYSCSLDKLSEEAPDLMMNANFDSKPILVAEKYLHLIKTHRLWEAFKMHDDFFTYCGYKKIFPLVLHQNINFDVNNVRQIENIYTLGEFIPQIRQFPAERVQAVEADISYVTQDDEIQHSEDTIFLIGYDGVSEKILLVASKNSIAVKLP